MTHLDYDVLADLAEGLLDETTIRDVESHLDSCEECGRKLDDLSAVSQLLASAPVPVMPESLAARLDEALMAEAAKAPVTSLTARRRFRGYQLLSAAAAVVVAGGLGTGVVVNSLSSSSGDSNAAAALPSSTVEKSLTDKTERTVRSGTDYRPDQLKSQVHDVVVRFNGRQAEYPPSSQLLACIKRIAKGQRLIMVDQAKYQGQDATVIVLAPTSGVNDVYVVGPECSAETDAQLAYQQVPA